MRKMQQTGRLGLMPCATIVDVNFINWLPRGAPQNWPLVYFSRGYGYFEDELRGLSFVEFLLQIISGESDLMREVGSHFNTPPEFEPTPTDAQQ